MGGAQWMSLSNRIFRFAAKRLRFARPRREVMCFVCLLFLSWYAVHSVQSTYYINFVRPILWLNRSDLKIKAVSYFFCRHGEFRMDSCKFSGKEAAAAYNIAIDQNLQYKKRQSILWYCCSSNVMFYVVFHLQFLIFYFKHLLSQLTKNSFIK